MTETATTYEIPKTMKRLVVTAPGKDVASCKIEVQDNVPVPEPASDEVLIKMVAAPVNPSDYGDWYRSNPDKYPMAMGKEGCGVVVKVGNGWMASMSFKVGAKVGVIGLKKNQGSYSEYVVAKAPIGEAFPLPDDMPVQDGASFFVNPYTVVGILETVRRVHKSNVLVHTAAASQLGQMMVKLAPDQGMQVINVVRRPDQAEMLKALGAKHVVVSQGDDAWKDDLKAKIQELGCTVAFDAVAGTSTGDMVECLPSRGTCYVYGGLAGNASNISPMDLIYLKKVVRGWELPSWIQGDGVLAMIWRMRTATNTVNAGLKDGGWSSTQFVDTTMDQAHADIVRLLGTSATGKKLRIRFD